MQFDFDIFTLFVGVAATTTLAVNELRVLFKAATLTRPNKNAKLLKLFMYRWLWNSPLLSDLYRIAFQMPTTGLNLIYTFLFAVIFEANMKSLQFFELAKVAGKAWCFVFAAYVFYEKFFLAASVAHVREQQAEIEEEVEALLAN